MTHYKPYREAKGNKQTEKLKTKESYNNYIIYSEYFIPGPFIFTKICYES